MHVARALQAVHDFSEVAGPELNPKKTEGLWIGRFSNSRTKVGGICWPTDPIKSLGIYFSTDLDKSNSLNWDSKIEKFERTLSQWRKRRLTLYGKVHVIKSIALPQLIYCATSLCVPKYVVKTVTKHMHTFLWESNRDRVKRNVLTAPIQDGGLNMPHIQSLFYSLKAKWIDRLTKCKDDDALWKLLPSHYLEHFGEDFAILRYNLDQKWLRQLECELCIIPEFYKEMLEAWIMCRVDMRKRGTNFREIRQEFLWGNKLILHNRKPLFLHNWMSSGIMCVNDLLDDTNKLNANYVCSKLKTRRNWIGEYNTVLDSLPKPWIRSLKQDESTKTKVKTNYDLLLSSNKPYYDTFVCKINESSYTEHSWNRLFDTNLQWAHLWSLLHSMRPKENRLLQYRFKLLHRILVCGDTLYRWRLSASNLCSLCHVVEDYEHLFVTCVKVKETWKHVISILHDMGYTNVKPHLKLMVAGYKAQSNTYVPVNFMLTVMGFSIYKCMCIERATARALDRFSVFSYEFNERVYILKQLDTLDPFLKQFCIKLMAI
jgi:hypothetical protein